MRGKYSPLSSPILQDGDRLVSDEAAVAEMLANHYVKATHANSKTLDCDQNVYGLTSEQTTISHTMKTSPCVNLKERYPLVVTPHLE